MNSVRSVLCLSSAFTLYPFCPLMLLLVCHRLLPVSSPLCLIVPAICSSVYPCLVFLFCVPVSPPLTCSQLLVLLIPLFSSLCLVILFTLLYLNPCLPLCLCRSLSVFVAFYVLYGLFSSSLFLILVLIKALFEFLENRVCAFGSCTTVEPWQTVTQTPLSSTEPRLADQQSRHNLDLKLNLLIHCCSSPQSNCCTLHQCLLLFRLSAIVTVWSATLKHFVVHTEPNATFIMHFAFPTCQRITRHFIGHGT